MTAIHYGKREPGSLTASSPGDTLYIPLNFYNDSGASISISNTLARTDIEVFKDGSTTERATDSGYGVLGDTGNFDSRTGFKGISIQLFNTADDANFYATGSTYWVAVDNVTVDARTVRFWAAVFEIGRQRVDVREFNDTGINDRLAKILADTDTGINNRFDTVDANIARIGTSTGSALSTDATTDNTAGGISGVTSGTTFVGSQTGTFANTSMQDGVYHVITHSANAFDIVYQFLIGAGAAPVLCVWQGYLEGNNDVFTISVWDHVGGAWETMATISGQSGTTNIAHNCPLFPRFVGTSVAELGKVYIRLHTSGQTSPVLHTDQIYVSYAVTSTDITAIKAKTDLLTFDTGGEIAADIKKVNNVTVTGMGDTGINDTWRPI
jgi:hypothetical protein